MTDRARNLLWRIVAACVLVPPLIAAVLWQRHEALAAILHIAVVLASAEFYLLTLPDEARWLRMVGVALNAAISVTLFWWPENLFSLAVASLLLITTINLLSHRDVRSATVASAMLFFGTFYVAVLLTTVGLIKQLPHGEAWVILALTITWFGDTAAYFVGHFIGKHRLYPAISPGKTVEGGIAGIAGACGAAILAHYWYLPELTWLDAVLIGIQAGALAIIGDLVESMFKRSSGAKDSGQLIPGHGGLLDRIDALLFAGPYIYLYAKHIIFS